MENTLKINGERILPCLRPGMRSPSIFNTHQSAFCRHGGKAYAGYVNHFTSLAACGSQSFGIGIEALVASSP
jgi:hypothetical protein